MKKGYIHIYCGDGKGKTSAALGLALRSAGRGFKVLIVRLMKDCDSGELNSLKSMANIKIIPTPEKLKFVFSMSAEEKAEYQALVSSMISTAIEMIKREDIDVLIVDEACSAVSTGMLNSHTLIDFLKNKPEGLEVVLTGRDPSDELITLADYVSEIRKIKHPYDNDTPPRRGIEM